jgi:hypothetical protein
VQWYHHHAMPDFVLYLYIGHNGEIQGRPSKAYASAEFDVDDHAKYLKLEKPNLLAKVDTDELERWYIRLWRWTLRCMERCTRSGGRNRQLRLFLGK